MPEHLIPATPGTRYVTYSGEENGARTNEQPVIGWRVTPTLAAPIVLGGNERHLPAFVVIAEGKKLFDLTTGNEMVLSLREWVQECDDSDGESMIHPKNTPKATKAEKAQKEEEAEKTIARGEYSIAFGAKNPFKCKSFWHYEDDETQFVFEIEGGEPLPDDPRVSKVNRADFTALKKDHGLVPLTRIVNAQEEPPADEEFDDGGLL